MFSSKPQEGHCMNNFFPYKRIYSVWFRHLSVYSKHFLTNAFPPFFEPLIFMAGIGLGLGGYLPPMEGFSFLEFLSGGLIVSTAMMTSSFECSYSTFVRLEFEKIYDAMVAAPLNINDIFLGEILWAGTKGFIFSTSVALIFNLFGILRPSALWIAPLVGLLTGMLFASIALVVVSFVKGIDQLSFYFSGIISPMMFLSGVVFPVSNLPSILKVVAEVLPLTHCVRIMRTFLSGNISYSVLFDFSYVIFVTAGFFLFAVYRLKKRILQ